VASPAVRIPELHRGVDVQHAPVVAPLHDVAAIDVPGQVDEEVAGREMFAEKRAQILRRDAVLDEGHALLRPGPQRDLVRLEVHATHGSTAKLANCQRSASSTGGAPHFPNRRDRLSSGVQLVLTDGQGPRYEPATSRISRKGSSSGTRMPLRGLSIMKTSPAST